MGIMKALAVLTVLAIMIFLFFVLMRNMKAGSTTSGSGTNIVERVANSLQFGVTGSSNLGATGSGSGGITPARPVSTPPAGTSGTASKTVAAQPKLNFDVTGGSGIGAGGSGTGGSTIDKCKGKSVFCCSTGLC